MQFKYKYQLFPYHNTTDTHCFDFVVEPRLRFTHDENGHVGMYHFGVNRYYELPKLYEMSSDEFFQYCLIDNSGLDLELVRAVQLGFMEHVYNTDFHYYSSTFEYDVPGVDDATDV